MNKEAIDRFLMPARIARMSLEKRQEAFPLNPQCNICGEPLCRITHDGLCGYCRVVSRADKPRT
ncbi:MAG: hypothetical protein KGH65_03655 [Candidatus Micrarchaeota archaeon]|nr:hypothetical protein [Candidatus Micrarchaeota archaeon]